MTRIPLPPHQIPALDPLINGDLWSNWNRDGLVFPVDSIPSACRYLRFKPETTSRFYIAGTDQQSADEPPQGYMLHLFPDRERANVAYAKEMSRRHTIGSNGFSPFLCEESSVVGIPYPNDPEIPELRHVYSPDRFRRTLNELLDEYPTDQWRVQRSLTKFSLLNYKPGRRAVYRIKVKIRRRVGDEKVRVRMHVKVENPKSAERSYQNLRRISQAIMPEANWRVPQPRGQVDRRTLMAAEWVEGTPLRELLTKESDGVTAFRRVGEALASFHRLQIELEHLPSPVEESDKLIKHSADLIGLLPDRANEIKKIGDELSRQVSRLALSPSSTVHGDFHLDQVLISEGRPVLVDLDRSGIGYAATDLGTFLAYLDEIDAHPDLGESFLESYTEHSPTDLSRDWLIVSRAIAIFRRAGFPFRELDPDWKSKMCERLEATDKCLGELGK